MRAMRVITLSLAIVLLAIQALFSVMVVVSSFSGGDTRTGTIYVVALVAHVLAVVALLNPRPKLAVVAAALLGICTGGAASEIMRSEWKYLVKSDLVAYHIEFLAFICFLAALLMRLSPRHRNAAGPTTQALEPSAAPNGGPATQLGNLGITERPPSAS